MACEPLRLKDGSMAIICGLKRSKSKPCQFCGAPGTKLCDWKCDKPVKIAHWDLQPEDTLVTLQHGHRLKVQGLQRFLGSFVQRVVNGKGQINADLSLGGPVVHHRVTMYGLVFPDGRCFLYYQLGEAKVSVLRPGTCDAPCCERHSREVGEDVDYCQDHWRDWERIG